MKSRRKGFTLLELQIVTVIIVALAVLIVPKLLQPIERARQEEHIAKARLAYLACQIIATEEYAKGASLSEINIYINDKDIGNSIGNSRLDRLLGIEMKGSSVTGTASHKGKIVKVEYIDQENRYKIILDNIDTGKGKIYLYDLKKEETQKENNQKEEP